MLSFWNWSFIWCLMNISGLGDIDYSLYPSLELQQDWLTTYLEHHKSRTGTATSGSERDVENLYTTVCKYSLVSPLVQNQTIQTTLSFTHNSQTRPGVLSFKCSKEMWNKPHVQKANSTLIWTVWGTAQNLPTTPSSFQPRLTHYSVTKCVKLT